MDIESAKRIFFNVVPQLDHDLGLRAKRIYNFAFAGNLLTMDLERHPTLDGVATSLGLPSPGVFLVVQHYVFDVAQLNLHCSSEEYTDIVIDDVEGFAKQDADTDADLCGDPPLYDDSALDRFIQKEVQRVLAIVRETTMSPPEDLPDALLPKWIGYVDRYCSAWEKAFAERLLSRRVIDSE